MTLDLEQLAKQVQYLSDHAAISDLLIAFAHAIDTKDWTGYADLFAADGVVEMPFKKPDGTSPEPVPKGNLARWVEWGLGDYFLTHHMMTNIHIAIVGDLATTRSYLQAVHRIQTDDTSDVWEFGGRYTCSMRRTDDGWKFLRLALEGAWEHGLHPLPTGPPPFMIR